MKNKMIIEAENAYKKFEAKADKIAAEVKLRLDKIDCDVSCDYYKGDGLCVCFHDLSSHCHYEYEKLYAVDCFVVPIQSIPKRGKIDVDFILKNSI
jgi:hypothetical protein